MTASTICRFLVAIAICQLIPEVAAADRTGEEIAPSGNTLVPSSKVPRIPGMDTLRLYQNRFGHILCEDDARAETMLAHMERAAADFKKHFGVDPAAHPGKGLYYRPGKLPAGTELKLLQALGSTWMLPVIDAESATGEEASKALARQVREDLRKQLPDASGDEIERRVSERMPMITAMMRMNVAMAADGINTHELGHMYFMNTYWHEWLGDFVRQAAPPQFYGSPAADWLDEAAAILLEGNTITETRWMTMRKIANGNFKNLLPVAELTTMKHPAKMDGTMQGTDATGVAMTQSTPGTEEFYAQCRAFAEFLMDRTGNPAILADIAHSEAEGKAFAAWLAGHGASNKLPSDLPALDSSYREWIRMRFAQVPASPVDRK